MLDGNLSHSHTPQLNLRSLPAVSLELRLSRSLSQAEFRDFCAENRDLRVEQDKNGKLIIIPPVDYEGGIAESEAFGQLYIWAKAHKTGQVFSPTTGFKLPDGSTRSADGAFVSPERLAALAPEDRKQFPRLVPDFVIEVRSNSDRLKTLKKKMTDTWLKNGVRLAWLIDPQNQKAHVYRPGGSETEIANFDGELSGEEVCPGFVLDLRLFKK
ncbi:MAG: Uma2 family endonuclease [Saprospiraceae bacterium]